MWVALGPSFEWILIKIIKLTDYIGRTIQRLKARINQPVSANIQKGNCDKYINTFNSPIAVNIPSFIVKTCNLY